MSDALPLLYKFQSIEGAKATLRTRSFRHAKPDTFNDEYDLRVQSFFPNDVKTTLKEISEGLFDVILEHTGEVPTCRSPKMAAEILAVQAWCRAKPETVKAFTSSGGAEINDLDKVQAHATQMLGWINEFMQGYRVFCVSKHRDWRRCGAFMRATIAASHYALSRTWKGTRI